MVYIFNPENDMALANNTIFYKAPGEIIRMKKDLSLLPFWYAREGSAVFTEDRASSVNLVGYYLSLGIKNDVSVVDSLVSAPYMPWGWSPALIHTIIASGVSEKYLPTVDEIATIRQLSGRQNTINILQSLSTLEYTCGKAVQCFTLSDVISEIQNNGQSILKSPWSGSGRGLVKVGTSLDSNREGWISRILRTQGSIMAEPFYNKVLDFAMEFYIDNQGMNFSGYSIFDTDEQGNYKCNVLASDASLASRLLQYVSVAELNEVRKSLTILLQGMLIDHYSGFLGVDMMICLHQGRYLIHPCVEINLRMNMGVVARIIYDRFVSPDVTGMYHVEHFFSDGEALLFQQQMTDKYPGRVKMNKFYRGYFPLTPVSEQTRFHVYILIS